EREHEVRRRPRADHERALPDRLRAERARELTLRGLLERVHARDADVAAEREGLHAVLRLAAPRRPQPRTESDEELLHLDPERLRHAEVRGLVDQDDQEDE